MCSRGLGLPGSTPWDKGLSEYKSLKWEVIPGSPSWEVKGGKEASAGCVTQQKTAGGGWYSVPLGNSGRQWRTWPRQGGWDIFPSLAQLLPPVPSPQAVSCRCFSDGLLSGSAVAVSKDRHLELCPRLLHALYLLLTPSTSCPLKWLGGRTHVVVTQELKKGKGLNACYHSASGVNTNEGSGRRTGVVWTEFSRSGSEVFKLWFMIII